MGIEHPCDDTPDNEPVLALSKEEIDTMVQEQRSNEQRYPVGTTVFLRDGTHAMIIFHGVRLSGVRGPCVMLRHMDRRIETISFYELLERMSARPPQQHVTQ